MERWFHGSFGAKLFSPVDEKQLDKYKKYVDRDIICISRAGKETNTKVLNSYHGRISIIVSPQFK